jgi:LPXTG-site transpeptidase (sortase) family protein
MKKLSFPSRFIKRPGYYLGNLLVLLSLVIFAYIFYPVLQSYLVPGSYAQVASDTYSLWIPKIRAAGKVIPNVDPWDEEAYRKALKQGIAQAKGTSVPGQHGTVYLFAHSSGPPWEQTRYNTIFLRLGELQRGDFVYVTWRGEKYTYKVQNKKVVSATDITYLQEKKDQLIIQTCTPIGTDWKRLLVFADPVTQ